MNLSRCPKEFNATERKWWKFYLPVVNQRGLMTIGKYTTLKDLCIAEGRLEFLNAIIRADSYKTIFSEQKWRDFDGVEQVKIILGPVIKQINIDTKAKKDLKKSLGLFEVPAENEKQNSMEGMLDG